MAIFESGVRDDRRPVARSRIADAGAGRVRRPIDAIGRTHYPKPHAGERGGISRALLAVSRLIFPVLLMVTAAAAAFIYGDEPARWLGDLDVAGRPFATGLLALPGMFFIVQLTNRRYGAGYALGQVVLTTILAFAAVFYMRDDLGLLRSGALPDLRLAVGFGGGLFLAELFSIVVFDRLRGPQWWQAPFFSSLFGGIVLCVVAFPAAYSGTGLSWSMPMFAYMGVTTIAALLMVLPYWMLRSLVEPLSGFGGY